jgi:hypothetical protein
MPTLAQQRIAALSAWFDRNSRWGRTPNGGALSVGRYASVIPWDFEMPPMADADPQALLFYVSHDQCDGASLADYDPAEAIDTQHEAGDRLEHILFKLADGFLPPVAIVGLEAPGEPIAAAVARAGLAIDLGAVPVLAVPLWPLSDGLRYRLGHGRLPFVPKADAPDPDMPVDYVPSIVGVRDLWP